MVGRGDDVSRCAPLPGSKLLPFRKCGGTRGAGGTVAASLIAFYRMDTNQIRRGRRPTRSSTSQGSAEPL